MTEDDYKKLASLISEAADLATELGDKGEFILNDLDKIVDETEKDPKEIPFAIEFIKHIVYRLKSKFDMNIAVNRVTEVASECTFFRISNYSWNMFMWATTFGFGRFINNDSINIPKRDMQSSVAEKFEKQVIQTEIPRDSE